MIFYSFTSNSNTYRIISKMNEHRLLILINAICMINYLLSCLDYFRFAGYNSFLFIRFCLIFFSTNRFSAKSAIALSQQKIIKMKFIMNGSNIQHWFFAGLCCLSVNSFSYVFVTYQSTHLLFCTHSRVSNRRKKQ